MSRFNRFDKITTDQIGSEEFSASGDDRAQLRAAHIGRD
jgi:hypothetical protein